MSDVVLDSSAVLALLHAEAGADAVAAVLPGALISTVNLAEVVAKLIERGALRPTTRAAGLSLGDRAGLALARSRGLAAMTADGAWSRAKGAEVRLIR